MTSAKPTCFLLLPLSAQGSEEAKFEAIAEEYVALQALEDDFVVRRRIGAVRAEDAITEIEQEVAGADLVLGIRVDRDEYVTFGLGMARASKKPVYLIVAKGCSGFLGEGIDVPFDIHPFSHRAARAQLRSLIGNVIVQRREPPASSVRRETSGVGSERAREEGVGKIDQMAAAATLIELMMGREGFSRIAFDSRQGRRLVVYGDQSLSREGIEEEIGGIPVEFRLN